MLVGFSTGALAPGDVVAGAARAALVAPGLVELSALAEGELASVEAVAAVLAAASSWPRVSVHGPAKGRVVAEGELVARLGALGLDVVMHPDVLVDVPAWGVLGSRLLVENNDDRKSFGGSVADLDAVFAVLGRAGFCLDVSHAYAFGGLGHVRALAAAYGSRLAQLHVGCAAGRAGMGVVLGPELLAGVAAAVAVAGRRVPVVLERAGAGASDVELVAQVRAVVAAC